MEEKKKELKETIQSIPIEYIDDFPNHPFKIQDDEQMQKLIQSIQDYGVITPVVVRKKEDDRYELISGHRRKYACKVLGIEHLPVIVRELSREEAVISMVDSNLQREHILPSEKAFAYKMKMDAMKRQGARTDLTSAPLAQKLPEQTTRATFGALHPEHIKVWCQKECQLVYLGISYKNNMEKKNAFRLDLFGKIVSEQNRIDILNYILKHRTATVVDINQAFGYSGSVSYYHLSMMKKAGMLKENNTKYKIMLYSINSSYFDWFSCLLKKYVE